MRRPVSPAAAASLLACALLLAACGANAAPEPPQGYTPQPDRQIVLDPLVKYDVADTGAARNDAAN